MEKMSQCEEKMSQQPPPSESVKVKDEEQDSGHGGDITEIKVMKVQVKEEDPSQVMTPVTPVMSGPIATPTSNFVNSLKVHFLYLLM